MGCLIDTWLIRTVTLRFQIPHVPVQSVTSVASTHMGQSGNSHSLNAVSKDHRYNTRVSTLKFNVAWELLARGSNLFLDSSPQPSPQTPWLHASTPTTLEGGCLTLFLKHRPQDVICPDLVPWGLWPPLCGWDQAPREEQILSVGQFHPCLDRELV